MEVFDLGICMLFKIIFTIDDIKAFALAQYFKRLFNYLYV